MKFRMAILLTLMVIMCGWTTSASASPTSLVVPTSYDNVGFGRICGQTFIAENSDYIAGVKWYIGDPTRPENDAVGPLDGIAYLVLYDAEDLEAPIEIGRSQIQNTGESSSGLCSFSFDDPIASTLGHSYFIALDTEDYFGIGLGFHDLSSYEFGAKTSLINGSILLPASGRDTSFEVETHYDFDNDGIRDPWEITHFGSTTNCVPIDDPDNDNYSNLEEYRNETDPNVWDVYVALYTSVELIWTTVNGTNYQVQSSTDLSSNSWVNVGDVIVGDDSTNASHYSTRNTDAKYFRVITIP